jgi:Putative peptidoglycan binding domain/HlyD family secretion protein
MKTGKRRWWLVVLIVVLVAAAAITAVLLLHRNNGATVHYLTSAAAKGTIAQTVQADFTLANAHDAMTISLGGTSPTASTAATTSYADSGITLVSLVTRGAGAPGTIVADSAILADTTPAPSLTSFTPASGPVGTSVTLTGVDLSGASAVAFNGRVAFPETVSDTQVMAVVPSGATTGPITVTTPGGMATSAGSFTVTSKPTPKPTPSRTRTPSPKPTVPYTGNSRASTSSYTGGSSSAASAATAAGSGSAAANATTGIVTRRALRAGAIPHTLQRLLTVSGSPIFAFVSSAPLYATLSVNLSSGAQATNVAALQRALKARGYYDGSINGDFGTTTETALKSWQSAHGLSQTGEITTSQFVWVPRGAVLESWNVAVGSHVSGTTALATVGYPHDLMAQALVTQADVSSLRVGEKAALTIDGATSDPFTATITSIADQPASSSSGGGSSSTVEYTVDLAPHGLPTLAKAGMTGSLTITIASRGNVLLVPTSAVSGTSSASFVRVMMNGTPAFRQVTTGMATSSLTQITSGLTAGEVVVTGQYSNNATTSASGTGGGLGIPGLGGGNGGFFRRNSSGSFGAGSSNGGAKVVVP